MTSVEVLPWHMSHWHRLNQQIDVGRLPHALLIAGPPMSGKSRLTEALTARLICREDQSPCGRCHQCQLLEAGTHPDILLITLEDSKQIVIDQVRGLIEWASQTSQQGGFKVCIVNPADKLNVQSANALLKCLEEPPSKTSIILVTDQPNKLLPTLRSRCQRVECHLPEKAEALAWLEERNESPVSAELLLEIAGGVPLRASQSLTDEYLEMRKRLASELKPVFTGASSPMLLAGALAKADPVEILDILYQLVADAIGYSMSSEKGCKNTDLTEEIAGFASAVPVEQRFRLLDRISRAKRIVGSTSNANAQMLFEGLLADVA